MAGSVDTDQYEWVGLGCFDDDCQRPVEACLFPVECGRDGCRFALRRISMLCDGAAIVRESDPLEVVVLFFVLLGFVGVAEHSVEPIPRFKLDVLNFQAGGVAGNSLPDGKEAKCAAELGCISK